MSPRSKVREGKLKTHFILLETLQSIIHSIYYIEIKLIKIL